MSGVPEKPVVVIAVYRPEYLDAFARLNRAWLEEHGLLEHGDLKHLEHPEESILSTGGEIFIALDGGEVVGTCGVILDDAETAELVKLTVASGARRQGIGRRLTETALAWARAKGVRRVWLVSSSRLPAALSLYERLGFRRRALPEKPGYATADVCMELPLDG
jgi:ribosomal protein S18 acetylase RimI-like enzyme